MKVVEAEGAVMAMVVKVTKEAALKPLITVTFWAQVINMAVALVATAAEEDTVDTATYSNRILALQAA